MNTCKNNKHSSSLLFFHIPKTAGISISSLIPATSVIQILRRDVLTQLNKQKYLLPYPDFSFHVTPKDLSDIVKNYQVELCYDVSFSVVRNPWSRVVSMYNYAHQDNLFRLYGQEKLTFDKFCEFLFRNKDNDMMLPVLSQTTWTHSVIKLDRILKFEHLKKDWPKFVDDYNLNLPDLPHLNTSKKVNYKSYYNHYTKNLIGNMFNQDIEIFEYVF